jgi:hypothetical protein
MLLIHLPHTQWYTELRIVTARAAHDRMVFLQQLIEPFFHNRFSITSGNADHRNGKTGTVVRGKILQSVTTSFTFKKLAPAKCICIEIFFHHEISYTTFIYFFDKLVPIPARSADGEEKGSGGENDFAAVDQQMFDRRIVCRNCICLHNGSDMLYLVNHGYFLYGAIIQISFRRLYLFFIVADGIKYRPENTKQYHAQRDEYLRCFIQPFVDIMFAQHFGADKYEYDGDTLLQVIEFGYGAPQQEKQRTQTKHRKNI